MTPNKKQIEVAIDELKNEAGVWEAQSEEIANIATTAEGLRLTRLEAGMFQLIVDPYDSVIDQVIGRCGEGKDQMQAIGDSLRAAAKTYAEEEQENIHAFKNLY